MGPIPLTPRSVAWRLQSENLFLLWLSNLMHYYPLEVHLFPQIGGIIGAAAIADDDGSSVLAPVSR